MAKKDYNDMTVAELKALAEKRGVHVPSDAKKDDIIAALEDDDESKPQGKTGEEAPEQQVDEPPVDPYADFADPVIDGTKPIIDAMTPSNNVLAVIVDGSNVRAMPDNGLDYDHLVFVQSGRSQEWLLPEASKRKFVQDKDGQIFYYSHGIGPTDEFKQVDMVALGT